MSNIDEFIDSLLQEKGVTDLDPEILATLKKEMADRLNSQINRAAVSELSNEQATELEQHLKDPNFTNELYIEFLKNAGVDIEKVVINTMTLFRNFYLGGDAEE